MAAQWRQLTEYLRRAGDQVSLTWSELDAIVGGLPASAVDHYPQWWHGDRPNTRAWRAAGYEATKIDVGVAVRFVRMHSTPTVTTTTSRPRHAPPDADLAAVVEPPESLHGLDSNRCLVVIPCSASKRSGGRPGAPVTAAAGLAAARRSVLADPDSHTDESLVMPAWRRYDGYLCCRTWRRPTDS